MFSVCDLRKATGIVECGDDERHTFTCNYDGDFYITIDD